MVQPDVEFYVCAILFLKNIVYSYENFFYQENKIKSDEIGPIGKYNTFKKSVKKI